MNCKVLPFITFYLVVLTQSYQVEARVWYAYDQAPAIEISRSALKQLIQEINRKNLDVQNQPKEWTQLRVLPDVASDNELYVPEPEKPDILKQPKPQSPFSKEAHDYAKLDGEYQEALKRFYAQGYEQKVDEMLEAKKVHPDDLVFYIFTKAADRLEIENKKLYAAIRKKCHNVFGLVLRPGRPEEFARIDISTGASPIASGFNLDSERPDQIAVRINYASDYGEQFKLRSSMLADAAQLIYEKLTRYFTQDQLATSEEVGQFFGRIRHLQPMPAGAAMPQSQLPGYPSVQQAQSYYRTNPAYYQPYQGQAAPWYATAQPSYQSYSAYPSASAAAGPSSAQHPTASFESPSLGRLGQQAPTHYQTYQYQPSQAPATPAYTPAVPEIQHLQQELARAQQQIGELKKQEGALIEHIFTIKKRTGQAIDGYMQELVENDPQAVEKLQLYISRMPLWTSARHAVFNNKINVLNVAESQKTALRSLLAKETHGIYESK